MNRRLLSPCSAPRRIPQSRFLFCYFAREAWLWSRRRPTWPNKAEFEHRPCGWKYGRNAYCQTLPSARGEKLSARPQSRFSFFVLSLCVGGGGKETRLGGRATHLGKKHRNNSARYLSQQLCSDFLSVTMSFSWKVGCESGKTDKIVWITCYTFAQSLWGAILLITQSN